MNLTTKEKAGLLALHEADGDVHSVDIPDEIDGRLAFGAVMRHLADKGLIWTTGALTALERRATPAIYGVTEDGESVLRDLDLID